MGLYTTLPISDSIREDLSLDFILRLSKTRSGIDSIMVVMNRLSKMTHFLPCKKTSDAHNVVRLFFQGVVRLHGASQSLTLDRDVKFISSFQCDHWKTLQIDLCLSSTYHPQTDEHTEIVKKSLGNMLCCFLQFKLKQWDEFLGKIEFAYNSIPNRSTGKNLFFCCIR